MIKGNVIANWTLFNANNPAHMATFRRNLKAYLAQPDSDDVRKVLRDRDQVQLFTTAGEMGSSIQTVVKSVMGAAVYDNSYEQLFDVVDFEKGDSFKVENITSGLTFAKVPNGGGIDYFPASGARVAVYFDKYGGGLSFDADLFEDQDGWSIEKKIQNFRNTAYRTRSLVFNGLIEAMDSSIDVAWQNPDPAALATSDSTYTASRDAQTIVAAYIKVAEACKDKGLPFIPGVSPMKLYAHYSQKGRIMKALSLVGQPVAGSANAVPYLVEPVFTGDLATTNKYYVCIPQGLNVAGYRKDLAIFDRFNQDTYSIDAAGWFRCGGIVEQEQFARCKMA